MNNDRIAGAANDAAGKVEGTGDAAIVLCRTSMVRPKTSRAMLAKLRVTSRRMRWTPAPNTIGKVAAHSPRL